jgi:coproporphyrinogen III oxidase-like Fe-S oxidoreductase
MFDLLDPPTEPEPQVRISIPSASWGSVNTGLLISALRRSSRPLSIYVHIISKHQRVSPAYIENLIAEMDLFEVAHGRPVTQVHWGGSPHALDTRQRIELFNAIVTRFPLTFGADVSIGLTPAAAPPQQSLEYDTEAGADLIGFGVGAISRAGNMFFQNFEDLESYEDAIAADRVPVSRGYINKRLELTGRRVRVEGLPYVINSPR